MIEPRGFVLGERVGPYRMKHDLQLFSVGRTTSRGSRSHNTMLGKERAQAVLGKLNSELGWVLARPGAEYGAGHMFGAR
jgi:hypothetical protein